MGKVKWFSAWQFIRGCGARDGILRAYRALGGKGYWVKARSLARGLLAARNGKYAYDAPECVLRRGKVVRL